VEKSDNSSQELKLSQNNKNSVGPEGGDKALIEKEFMDSSGLLHYSSNKENSLEEIKKLSILLSKNINNNKSVRDSQSNNPKLSSKDSEKESAVKDSNHDINLSVQHSKENTPKNNITNIIPPANQGNNIKDKNDFMTSSGSSGKLSIEQSSDKLKGVNSISNDEIQLKNTNVKNKDENTNAVHAAISESLEKNNTIVNTDKNKLDNRESSNTNLMVQDQMFIEKSVIHENIKDISSCKQNDKSNMEIDNKSIKDKSLEEQNNDNSTTIDKVDGNSSMNDQENGNKVLVEKLKKDNVVEKNKDLDLNKKQNEKMSVVTKGESTKNKLNNNSENKER